MRLAHLEHNYASVADELNDGTPGQLTLEDLEPWVVENAKQFALANRFTWPPQTGDFDRYYEWKHK